MLSATLIPALLLLPALLFGSPVGLRSKIPYSEPHTFASRPETLPHPLRIPRNVETAKIVRHRGSTLGFPPVILRDTPGPIQKSQRHTGNRQNALRLDGQSVGKNLSDAVLLLLILIILKLRAIEHSKQILLSLICLLLFVVRVDAYTEMSQTYNFETDEVVNDVISLASGNYVLVGASRSAMGSGNWIPLVVIIDSTGTYKISYYGNTCSCSGCDIIGYGGAPTTAADGGFVVLAARPADCTGSYRPYLMKFTYSGGTLTLSWAKQCDQVASEGRKVLYLSAGGAFALLGTNSASFLVVTTGTVITCYTTLSPQYSFAGMAEITGTIYAVGTDAVNSNCVVVPMTTACAYSTVFSFGSIAEGATYSCNGIRKVSSSEFVIIGQKTLPTGLHPVMYVAKGTTSGDTAWEKTFDYGSAMTGMAVTSLANGELIFVGYYSALVIIRADSTGVQSEDYGSDCASFLGNAVTLTSDGAIVVGGTSVAYSTKYMFLRVRAICPVGAYLLPSTGCGPCISSCDKCTKDSDCTTCSSNFYLFMPTSTTYQCLSECPTGYFASGGKCLGCGTPTTCQKCSSATYCYACQNGLYTQVQGSTSYCTATCLQGYFQDYAHVSELGASTFVCTKCPSVCSACNDASHCTICNYGYYLHEDYCYNCPSYCGICSSSNACTNCYGGYYLVNAYLYCSQCLSNCASCTDSETCAACYGGFYLVTSTSPNQCVSCISNCCICTNSSACAVCWSGYFLTPSSTCVAVCPQTFFANSNTGTCQSCGTGCVACTNSTYCTACSSGGFLYNPSIGNRSCISDSDCAALGPYYTSYSNCYHCSYSCATCTSGAGCTSCPSGSYWQGAYCANPCSVGYYPGTNDMTCKLCMANCLTCTSLGKCTGCKAGYFVAAVDGSSDNTCASCILNCISCNSSSTCEQCSTGTYLYSTGVDPDRCMNVCPDYYFGSPDGNCKSCIINCKTCSNAKQCTTCGPSYFLYRPSSGPDQCLNPCPVGYYGEPTSSPPMCKPCTSPCLACTTSKYCTDCGATLYIDPLSDTDHECSPSCRSYFYPLEKPTPKSCQPCLANCISCTNSTRCVLCDSAHFRRSDTDADVCVSDCGKGYFATLNPNVCTACDFRCLTCTNSTAFSCPSCNTDIDGVTQTNVLTCGCMAGYVTNVEKKKCLSCTDGMCTVCDLNELNKCIKCSDSVAGLYLDTTSKACMCVAGKYRTSAACAPCNSLCAECTGGSNTQCTKCASKAYPMDGLPTTCYYMCINSEGTLYLDSAAGVCKYCQPPCESCTAAGASSCLSCLGGKFLLNGQCLSQCPDKYYVEAMVCLPCHESCKQCSGQSTYCLSCVDDYFFKENKCVKSCGDGYMVASGNICMACDSGCTACKLDTSGSKVCTKCVTGTYRQGTGCSYTCNTGTYPDDGTGECTVCATECTSCYGKSAKECYACNWALGYVKIAPTTCSFPYCTQGTYYNQTLRSCKSCKTHCTYCTEEKVCEECDTGFKWSTANFTCYDKCGSAGLIRDTETDACVEVCGDGKNMGLVECDDGNRKNGDGCNSACQIEKDYECTGGNSTHPDVCVNRKPPEIVTIKYYANRTVLVIFDKYVKIERKFDRFMQFSVEGGSGSYVSWSYGGFKTQNKLKSITFAVGFNYSLSGSEYLVLAINNEAKDILDMNENALKSLSVRVKLAKYRYISSSDANAIAGAGTASYYAMLTGIIVSLGISLVFNTPIEGMWAAMSVMQMISYLTLLNLNYPQNVISFLEYVESVYNFNSWLPNPFSYMFPGLEKVPYNAQFASRGFTSRNMLYLCGSDLIMLALMASAILVLVPLSKVCALFGKLLDKLRYSSITRSFIQSYLKFCLAAFTNLGAYEFGGVVDALSALVSIMVSCVLATAPVLIYDFIYQNYQLVREDKAFRQAHSSFIAGFRVQTNLMNAMFYPIYLFRRLTFAGIVVLLYDYPSVQLALISIGTFAFIYYMCRYKPFSSKYSLYCAATAEGSFGLCTLVMYAFISQIDDSVSNILGWAVIVNIVLSLLIAWFCVGLQQYAAYKAKKKRRAEKEQEKIRAQEKSSTELEMKQRDAKDSPEQPKKQGDDSPPLKAPQEISPPDERTSLTVRNVRVPGGRQKLSARELAGRLRELQEETRPARLPRLEHCHSGKYEHSLRSTKGTKGNITPVSAKPKS